MKITKKDLKRAGACKSGRKKFKKICKEICGKSHYEVQEWTAVQQMGLMMHPIGRHYIGWLVAYGLIPLWSMREWNLSGAILRGAILSGAILSGADLSGAI